MYPIASDGLNAQPVGSQEKVTRDLITRTASSSADWKIDDEKVK